MYFPFIYIISVCVWFYSKKIFFFNFIVRKYLKKQTLFFQNLAFFLFSEFLIVSMGSSLLAGPYSSYFMCFCLIFGFPWYLYNFIQILSFINLFLIYTPLTDFPLLNITSVNESPCLKPDPYIRRDFVFWFAFCLDGRSMFICESLSSGILMICAMLRVFIHWLKVNKTKICPLAMRWRSTSLKVKVLVAQLYLTFCDLMDCSPPGSSVHGIL